MPQNQGERTGPRIALSGRDSMRDALRDFRYAARVLRRTPAFTAVAVATLALGIAVTTAVFGWIDGIVLHPFPGVRDDGQLAVLESMPAGEIEAPNVSYADSRDFQESLISISGLALSQQSPGAVGDGEGACSAWFELVSGNYFDVMGVRPRLGRAFAREEYGDRAKAFTAVISDRLWRRCFQGDTAILGRTVAINRHTVTIIGVTSPEFHGDVPGIAFDAWIPAPLAGAGERGARQFRALVRLKPGVRVAQADAEARTVAARLAQAFPKTNRGTGARIVPVWRAQSGLSRILATPLAILGAACGLVLLIACANVANLLLARSAARQAEFGIRAALGAGPGRLGRQLVAESVLLAGAAALAGLPLALWAQEAIGYLVPPTGLPLCLDVAPGSRVFLFVTAVCLGSALIAGMPPGLHALRTRVADALKQGGRGDTHGVSSRRLSGLLVTGEVGLALAALVTLGLFVRSLQGLRNTPAGFDHRNVTVSRLFLSTNNYTTGEELAFTRRLRARLVAVPGVTGAAYSDTIPLGFGLGHWTHPVVEGYAARPGEMLDVRFAAVSPGYFGVLRIPLLGGRDFRLEDTGTAPRVMIVNESFARQFFGGRDPLGHRVWIGDQAFRIVGLAKDSKYASLAESPLPYFYLPFDQAHRGSGDGGVALYARTEGDARGFAGVLRREMSAIDPDSSGLTVMPLTGYIGAAWFAPRMAAVLLGVLGGIAMLMAGVGLYGVMAYSVSQRTREFGIRLALGARPGNVLRAVLREGLLLAMAGVAAGLLVSLAATLRIEPMLYRVRAVDPPSIAGAAAFLLLVALLACLVPAWRATRVDPMTALRRE